MLLLQVHEPAWRPPFFAGSARYPPLSAFSRTPSCGSSGHGRNSYKGRVYERGNRASTTHVDPRRPCGTVDRHRYVTGGGRARRDHDELGLVARKPDDPVGSCPDTWMLLQSIANAVHRQTAPLPSVIKINVSDPQLVIRAAANACEYIFIIILSAAKALNVKHFSSWNRCAPSRCQQYNGAPRTPAGE